MFRYQILHCKRFDRPDPADDLPFPSAYEGERKKYEATTKGALFAFVCPFGDS